MATSQYQSTLDTDPCQEKDITKHEPFTFTVIDPRDLDGDPYEVAERAVLQAAALARLLLISTQTAHLMARNAELERQLRADGSCDAEAYDTSPQGLKFARVYEATKDSEKALKALALAAGYNPNSPIGG